MYKKIFNKHYVLFILGWLSSALKGSLVLFNIVALENMVDYTVQNKWNPEGITWLLFMLSSLIIIHCLNLLIGNIKVKLSTCIKGEYNLSVLQKCDRIEYSCYENRLVVPTIDRVFEQGASELEKFYAASIQTIEFVIKIAGVITYIGAINWLYVLLIFGLTIPVWMITILGSIQEGNFIQKYWKWYQRAKLYSDILNSRGYAKEGKIFNFYSLINRKWKEMLSFYQKGKIESSVKARVGVGFINFIQYALTILLLALLIKQVKNGTISLGILIAGMDAIWELIGSGLFVIVSQIESYISYLNYVKTEKMFFSLPEEKRNGKYDLGKVDSIEFKNVWYKYPNEEEYVLKDINLRIDRQEHVALVGENGCGKSTLAKLLVGLLNPEKGEIRINNRPADEFSLSSRRKAFACVFQDYVRYDLSVAENITLSEKYSAERVKWAINQVDPYLMSEFGDNLGVKLGKLTVDERDLSGGQWQKIAIARAIYCESDFIVMDEPTAAVDPILERVVIDKITKESREKTSLVITHRLGSVLRMDKVVVMQNGKIKAEGSHEELLKGDEYYAEFYHSQEKWYR